MFLVQITEDFFFFKSSQQSHMFLAQIISFWPKLIPNKPKQLEGLSTIQRIFESHVYALWTCVVLHEVFICIVNCQSFIHCLQISTIHALWTCVFLCGSFHLHCKLSVIHSLSPDDSHLNLKELVLFVNPLAFSGHFKTNPTISPYGQNIFWECLVPLIGFWQTQHILKVLVPFKRLWQTKHVLKAQLPLRRLWWTKHTLKALGPLSGLERTNTFWKC